MPSDTQKVVEESRANDQSFNEPVLTQPIRLEAAITLLNVRINTLADKVDQVDEGVRLKIDVATSKLKAQIASWMLIAVSILQTAFICALILEVAE